MNWVYCWRQSSKKFKLFYVRFASFLRFLSRAKQNRVFDSFIKFVTEEFNNQHTFASSFIYVWTSRDRQIQNKLLNEKKTVLFLFWFQAAQISNSCTFQVRCRYISSTMYIVSCFVIYFIYFVSSRSCLSYISYRLLKNEFKLRTDQADKSNLIIQFPTVFHRKLDCFRTQVERWQSHRKRRQERKIVDNSSLMLSRSPSI